LLSLINTRASKILKKVLMAATDPFFILKQILFCSLLGAS
jgi:hypothetical protein